MKFFYSLAALALGLLPASEAQGQSKEALALQDAMHRLIDDAEPSIACILVSRSERYREFRAAPSTEIPGKLGGFDARPHIVPFLEPSRLSLIKRLDLSHPDTIPEAYGSGVVIDAELGLVLTMFHVVQNATKVYVRFPNQKGSYADVYAGDGRSDLAVLKLIQPAKGLKAIRMGDGDKVRKGDWVVSMANPFAVGFRDGSPSASWGILSNIRRRAPGSNIELERTKTLQQYGTLLQTDARLNLGCSGGALLNLEGNLIGLTTSTAALTGGETAGGYAVPMTLPMRQIIDTLRRGEEVEYGFLGITVNPGETVDPRGVVIDGVAEETPAARAGLYRGQVLRSVNGQRIRDLDDMFLQIAIALAGSNAVVEVELPNGGLRKITIPLARFSNPFPTIAANRPRPVYGLRVDYGSVIKTDLSIPAGVSIRELERDSLAERKLKDLVDRSKVIIVSVNGKPVTTPREFYREAERARGPIELKLVEVSRIPESTARIVTFP